MSAAAWSAGRPTISVGTDGTMTVSVDLLDSKVRTGTFTFQITADRALVVTFSNAPGAAGLSDFRAWSKQEG